VREAAEAHGIIPGIHTSGSVLSNRYLQEGFKMVMLTTDTAGVIANARSEMAAIQDTLKAKILA
jgi:hypothetical protein